MDLPWKGMIPIFITTFLLVFVIFTMVEPSFSCSEATGECSLVSSPGDFILGIAISGVLFLIDMGLVYMILSDIML